jgi:hypothetical protein
MHGIQIKIKEEQHMVLVIEPIVLIVVIIIVYLFLHSIEHAIINTVMGLIILALTNFIFHLGIPYSIWTLLVCAIGGVPGAFLVIVFHILGIAF